MKRYNLRCQYCGTDYYVNWYWLCIKLIIFGEVRHQCEYCLRQRRHILVGHIVHDADIDEKVYNHEIKEHKRIHWIRTKNNEKRW